MATNCIDSSGSNPINQQPQSVASQLKQHNDPPQLDYDFVDQPDQDYFCPVSLELLTQPHQTTCCGNHISQQAANRLIREGKPCPLCKKDNFTTLEDLYFTRKIRQLKVRCPYKNECEWTGELGDLNQHTTSCPNRPWKCPYCLFQSTYNIGITDHAPHCDYQPVPCPNHCQVGTVPLCHTEKHLLTCPLQLVDCEHASAGCDVRVPRKDLASHMTESAQSHLMTATLLNMQLIKELHKKIEVKDQQIIELQTHLEQLDANFQVVSNKLEQLNTKVDTKSQKIESKLQEQDTKVVIKTNEVKTSVEATKMALRYDLQLLMRGFTCHEITLIEFTQCQAQGGEGRWSSNSITTNSGHPFALVVFTNGVGDAQGTHLTINIVKRHDKQKTEALVILQLLNQLGDHGHFIGDEKKLFDTDRVIALGNKFFPLNDLGFRADNNTQYLKDNCLKFRLLLKVNILN